MNYDKKLSVLDLPTNRWSKDTFNTKWKWYEELWFDICSRYDHITSTIRGVFIGIKNIIIYAPIIYNTREWDYDYLLDLVKFKLKRMSKDMVDSKIIVNYQECVSEMNRTIKFIDDFRNSVEVYEKNNQDKLKTIIDEKNDAKAEELTKDFFFNTYKFEEECWNNVWDNIKENGRGWWT